MIELALPVRVLGPAGVAPQVLCLVLAMASPWPMAATIAGLAYSGLILSFLGGMWWMAGLLIGYRPWWLYLMAITPSLVGWAGLVLALFGQPWVNAGLVLVGAALLASPLADRAVARVVRQPARWVRLRVLLAAMLGALTLALAVV